MAETLRARCISDESLAVPWSGDHPGEPVGLGEGDQADDGCEQDAVPEGGTEDFAFLSDEADGDYADGDVLRGDHLACDRSGGVGDGEQDGAQMELVGCGDLKIAEEKVAGGVAAGEKQAIQPRNPLSNGNAGPTRAKVAPRV